MHETSMENMKKLFDKYLTNEFVSDSCKLLDFGGRKIADHNSYYDLITNNKIEYQGVDIEEGPGVSIVLKDPYKVPLGDNYADVIISGQMFEHCEFFWLSFLEMVRVVKNGGYIFLIAPMSGVVHRYPVDCWRFYPDAWPALAKWGNVDLIEAWTDNRGWQDQVGAFRKPLVTKQGENESPVFAHHESAILFSRTVNNIENDPSITPSILRELQELKSTITNLDKVNYKLGTEVNFGSIGNALLFVREGWGIPQSGGTWTVGNRSVLRFALNESANNSKKICFTAHGFSAPGRKYTIIRILVNGLEIEGEFHLGDQFESKELNLPTVIAGKLIEIVIKIENPCSPSEFGISADTRKLGIFIQKMVVEAG